MSGVESRFHSGPDSGYLYQKAIRQWVAQWNYDLFISLSFNSPYAWVDSPRYCIEKLKEFDARANNKLLGRRWAKLHDLRIWGFYFLEKADRNPHWHGVIRFIARPGKSSLEQACQFKFEAPFIWRALVAKGSVDVKHVTDQFGMVKYVTKELSSFRGQDTFVMPDQFRRGG